MKLSLFSKILAMQENKIHFLVKSHKTKTGKMLRITNGWWAGGKEQNRLQSLIIRLRNELSYKLTLHAVLNTV